MACLSNSVAVQRGVQELSCQYMMPGVFSSVSTALPPRHGPAQKCYCQKEILGTALFPQNAPLQQVPYRQQRRFTIEAAKRLDNKRTFLLNSTLKAQDLEVDKVAKLCDGIRDWAREKMKDANSGCKAFECYVDLYEKHMFHFMEEYTSVLNMNDFRASPEHTKFFEEVRPLLLEPIGLAVYELRDGNVSCMLNPIGPKGEGGLDDATGQAGRGGEAYMKPIPKKRRGIESQKQFQTSLPEAKASEGATQNQWSFEKIISRVLGQDQSNETNSEPTKEEQWSLKSFFGKKK